MTASTSNQANATTTRSQGGQFAPSDEQRAKAEKLALQRAEAERLRRLEALYAQYLNYDPESVIATQIATGDFYMSKRQCHAYYKERKGLESASYADDPDSDNFIRTQAHVNFFLKQPNTGVALTDFKVVVETPTQDLPHTDFFIRVYLLAHHRIYKVKLLTVFDFLSQLQKTVLLSFMHQNYALATN
jgi:hypothetical protein